MNEYYERVIKKLYNDIEKMNPNELNKHRSLLLKHLDHLNFLKTESSYEEKKKYYTYLEMKYIRPTITKINDRIKTFNRIKHNGITKNLAIRFMQIAFEELSIDEFQKIYGLALSDEDIENQTIADIKQFMKDSKDKTK